MQEQLIHTLEEENKQLLHQTNKLLEQVQCNNYFNTNIVYHFKYQNQELLVRTLQTKDRCLEDEKLFRYDV